MGKGMVKYFEDMLLEVRVLDDGAIMTRRKDRKPMTPADYKEALRLAASSPEITAIDALRASPGANVRRHRDNER
jgi:hypothetical protein